MENDNVIIILINQALSKLDEDLFLVSTFQVIYNGTVINTVSMQFKPRSQFVIVLPNEYTNNTVVKFTIRGVCMGVPVRTTINKYLDTLSVYKIKIPLFWDLSRKLHIENEMNTQQGSNIIKEQRVIINRRDLCEG